MQSVSAAVVDRCLLCPEKSVLALDLHGFATSASSHLGELAYYFILASEGFAKP